MKHRVAQQVAIALMVGITWATLANTAAFANAQTEPATTNPAAAGTLEPAAKVINQMQEIMAVLMPVNVDQVGKSNSKAFEDFFKIREELYQRATVPQPAPATKPAKWIPAKHSRRAF